VQSSRLHVLLYVLLNESQRDTTQAGGDLAVDLAVFYMVVIKWRPQNAAE